MQTTLFRLSERLQRRLDMKIKKREQFLLVILLIAIICLVYYMFFMKKHWTEFEQMETEKKIQQATNEEIQKKAILASDIDKKTKLKKKKIKELSKDKYSVILQENQVVLLKRLARDTGFVIKSMNFSESHTTLDELVPTFREVQVQREVKKQLEEAAKKSEESGDGQTEGGSEENESPPPSPPTPDPNLSSPEMAEAMGQSYMIDVLDVIIDFEANYPEVDAYLKNIQDHDKKIVVSDLNFENKSNEKSTGSMTVHFFGIRDLEEFVKKTEENYFNNTYVRNDPTTAYIPYASFVILNKVSAATDTKIVKGESDFVFGSGDVKVEEDSTKTVRLDSFEDFDVFFLGSSGDVYGQTRLSSRANDLKNSLKVTYDFFNPAVDNRANILFDKNKKIIYEKVSNIKMDAYLEKNVDGNKLGFVIMDSSGNEEEFYFDEDNKYGEWITLSKGIDGDLQYPIMIKSIFIEGKSIYQSVKGELYIDNLSYEVE